MARRRSLSLVSYDILRSKHIIDLIVLAGEMLSAAEPFLERKMHPTVVVSAFRKALEEGLEISASLQYFKEVVKPHICDSEQGCLRSRS